MELTLTRSTGTQVQVSCNTQPSHTFDLSTLPLMQDKPPKDPVAYGRAAFAALFPPSTPAHRALDAMTASDHILLLSSDDDLDAIPWEYAYGPDSFLVTECPFVRGLPPEQRIPAPMLPDDLHIVAIPSNPLSHDIEPLNIDAEWLRLKEIIDKVPYTITLDRTRPPTIEQTRRLVAGQHHRVVHFMGHGGQDDKIGAFLCFEQDNGALDPVTAREFVQRLRGTTFLVTLNACVSATPGPTPFSNLAAALVRQKVPYALGMRFSVHDDDALAFSRVFYSELASGVPVEEALLQARLTLSKSPRPWVIGVPVLYTALAAPAPGFHCTPGTPTINEHQPYIDALALPRAQGAFQGRIKELQQLGSYLTGDNRPRIVTIHGSGGQGKTALAREAVERFAYAWLGGAWATTLETLPSRETFVNDLARFLGIVTGELPDLAEIERQALARLSQRRTLIVLDNVETLVEAVEAKNEAALHLVQFLLERLLSPMVCLLVTSREYLGWEGEVGLGRDLEGLAPEEGARLFAQSAPQRRGEIDLALARELSRKLDGHPLSLRLLGGAFNDRGGITLPTFVTECETYLLQAENKYVGSEHRHRTLYACIEVSVRSLDPALAALLRKLWLFHAPFLPTAAVAIFDPEHKDNESEEEEVSPIYNQLYSLWRRGLLQLETATVRDGELRLYRLLPTIRTYIEHHMKQADEREQLLARFGTAYAQLASSLYRELDRGGMAAVIAMQCREDLEQGLSYVAGVEQGYYCGGCGTGLLPAPLGMGAPAIR